MNKKIEDFLLKHNLQVLGNEAYGRIRDYEVNFFYVAADNVAPVRWHIAFHAPVNVKINIIDEIKKANIKFLKYDVDSFGISFGINGFTLGSLVDKLDEVLDTIFNILEKYECKNSEYCPMCGEEFIEESKVYNINGVQHKLHTTCGAEVANAFNQANKEFDQMPNNIVKGILGAVLGAIVGCVSYVIFYYMGFISTISAIISIVLGSLLYKKFGGKPNALMIVITTVVTILMLMLTVYLLYALTAVGFAAEYGLTLSLGEAFSAYMEDPEFSRYFYSDLGMTVLFSLIGAGYEAVSLSKNIQRKHKIH